MKKVAVIGASGNMGRRYAMILEQFTSCEVIRIDEHNKDDDLSHCDGFIIATPTDTHYAVIKRLSAYEKPMLCEKPLIKSIPALKEILGKENIDISMINQYEFLADKYSLGHTYYNYFKTGSDSLYWDCINIIGIAKSTVHIANDSLIWECVLNGKYISIQSMDLAYIDNIVDWVAGWRNKDYILSAHEKVWEMINAQESK